MSQQDLGKPVQVLIFSGFNHCNTVFLGLSKKSIRRQLIQNTAAQPSLGGLLRSLHWLPVHQTIDFKILLLVYKALDSLGPK